MRPRTASPTPARTLTVDVRVDDGVERWQPATPSDGWTPAVAFDRACSFAVRSAGHERRRTGAAYQTLLGVVPGLKRAEIRERLSGEDHFRAHFEPDDYADNRPAVLEDLPF